MAMFKTENSCARFYGYEDAEWASLDGMTPIQCDSCDKWSLIECSDGGEIETTSGNGEGTFCRKCLQKEYSKHGVNDYDDFLRVLDEKNLLA